MAASAVRHRTSNSSSSGTSVLLEPVLLCRRSSPNSAVSSGRALLAAGPSSAQNEATLSRVYVLAVHACASAGSSGPGSPVIRHRAAAAGSAGAPAGRRAGWFLGRGGWGGGGGVCLGGLAGAGRGAGASAQGGPVSGGGARVGAGEPGVGAPGAPPQRARGRHGEVGIGSGGG